MTSNTKELSSEDVRELAKALNVADLPEGEDTTSGEASAGWEAAKQGRVVMARRLLRILKSDGYNLTFER